MTNRAQAGSVTLTLRLKVRPESYAWLDAAAIEVNQIWNFCNERAATVLGNLGRWLSGFDLCYETAGSTQYMKRIGADTIQRVCIEYAAKRNAVRKQKLCWRVSRGARRSLGWVPFKAVNVKRKGKHLRFAGKAFRVFEAERLDGVKWKQGCFAQDAVGDWWLCLPVERAGLAMRCASRGRWHRPWACVGRDHERGRTVRGSAVLSRRAPRRLRTRSATATSAKQSVYTAEQPTGVGMLCTSSVAGSLISIRTSSLAT